MSDVIRTRKAKKTALEKDILRDIGELLKENNLFFWRSNNIPVFGKNNGGSFTFRSMPKFSLKGVPDLIVIRGGKFIGLEVKRPGAVLRPDQIKFGKMCKENGAEYYCVHSREEVKEVLSI